MREQDDRFFGMIYKLVGETWLIFDQECDAVFAGNVFCSDDGELIPRNSFIKADAKNLSARDAASHGDAVNHFRKSQVVDIARASGDLFAAFLAGNRFSDLAVFHVRP